MPQVGKGAREICIAEDDGWFRVFYVAEVGGEVCVLYGFQKKSNQTPRQDIETGEKRYKQAVADSKH